MQCLSVTAYIVYLFGWGFFCCFFLFSYLQQVREIDTSFPSPHHTHNRFSFTCNHPISSNKFLVAVTFECPVFKDRSMLPLKSKHQNPMQSQSYHQADPLIQRDLQARRWKLPTERHLNSYHIPNGDDHAQRWWGTCETYWWAGNQ